MKKTAVRFILVAVVAALLLSACSEERVLPSATPIATANVTPQPPLSPSPSMRPRPTDSAEVISYYPVTDFLPLADIFIRYSSKLSAADRNVYVEFFDEELHAVQRKILSSEGPIMEVLRCEDGKLIRTHLNKNIGYTYNFINSSPNDDEILLSEPIKVSNQWKIKGGTREITAVDKLVSIPIGSFSTVEISTYYDDGSRCVQYYMRSVGLIAQYDLDEKGLLSSVYEATFREKNNGFPQRVRFYFANMEKGIVNSIMREVLFSPHTDPKLRFATELRNVPGASGLIPLSPNVRILSIVPNFKGGVSVDFSHQLISEMDLGADGENLLLSAIAKTFAEYYQANRVFVTIEGGPYESPYKKLPLGKSIVIEMDTDNS